jgi:hypothetical protein
LTCFDGERRSVPDVAHVDAAAGKTVVSLHDVVDDECGLDPSGSARREPQAERDRSRRARRCQLDEAKPVHRGDVVIEPPTQLLVERLRAVDVIHGDDLVFKPQVRCFG